LAELNFHVRHEVTPERVWDILTAIAEGYTFEHIVQSDRQIGRMRQLGLLAKKKSDLLLTHVGHELYSIGQQKPEAAMELLHFLHYSLWKHDNPLENTLSWSYRTYCDLLFQRGACSLDSDAREVLTSELNAIITGSEIFAQYMNQTQKGAVSLSTNSLNGMNHWLRRLNPSVIDNDTFSIRTFCPPELLIMAIGFVSGELGSELGVDQLLSTERREAICRICLLDPNSLDRSIEWMLPLYPNVIEPGTHTGSYGRFIRLLHLPTLNDLLR
jgi:hypothetical protein